MTGFPALQAKLRESQAHVLDRPDPAPADPPRTQRKLALWVGGAMAIIGGIALLRGCDGASAAERPGKYEITLIFPGDSYESVSRTFMTLGEPYETKVDCDVAITRVKVMVKGARLRCDPIEKRRVN